MALNIVEATRFAEDETGKKVEAIDVSSIVAEQKVTVGAGSTDSSPFNARTRVLMVHAEEATRIAWGTSPTAAATSATRLIAGQTVFFSVPGNVSSFKLATTNG